MKLIIAGIRYIDRKAKKEITWPFLIDRAIKFFEIENITQVVCGKALGIDTLGENWARKNKIDVAEFPAKWKLPSGKIDYGAGPKRNEVMAGYADGLLAIWDRNSKGTRDMIERALKHKLDVWIYYLC